MYRIRYGSGTLALAVLLLLGWATAGADSREIRAVVVRVVDGDTIRVQVDGRTETVRYIGVNSPELHHPARGAEPGGAEAAAVNRGLVEGRPVRLVLDVRSHDRHRRLLAYVYVEDTMANAEMVRLGYAQAMTVPPNVRHERLFRDLERQARASGRGLWSAAATPAP